MSRDLVWPTLNLHPRPTVIQILRCKLFVQCFSRFSVICCVSDSSQEKGSKYLKVANVLFTVKAYISITGTILYNSVASEQPPKQTSPIFLAMLHKGSLKRERSRSLFAVFSFGSQKYGIYSINAHLEMSSLQYC